MKSIIGALLLVPAMSAVALAQVPTADAKEGRVYLEGGIGFGVASMAADAGSSKGFNSEPLFTAGFAGEYGITEQIGVIAKFGIGLVLHDDPSVLTSA
jgi:opacity protein-like surface antigen